MAALCNGSGSVVSRDQAQRPKDFAAMKAMFPATDKVGEFHVFDIGGNKLRLIASVQYRMQRVYIKHLLDHRDYEKNKWKEKIR